MQKHVSEILEWILQQKRNSHGFSLTSAYPPNNPMILDCNLLSGEGCETIRFDWEMIEIEIEIDFDLMRSFTLSCFVFRSVPWILDAEDRRWNGNRYPPKTVVTERGSVSKRKKRCALNGLIVSKNYDDIIITFNWSQTSGVLFVQKTRSWYLHFLASSVRGATRNLQGSRGANFFSFSNLKLTIDDRLSMSNNYREEHSFF